MKVDGDRHRGAIIALAGIIGSGKSTLGEQFGKKCYTFLPEHISEFLNDFYENPAEFVTVLQFDALLHRIIAAHDAFVLAHNGVDVVMDQYLLGDWSYAVIGISAGKISPDAADLYLSLLRESIRLLGVADVVLFLDPSIKECQSNILARGREAEKSIGDDYLVQLQANMRAARVLYPHYNPRGTWTNLSGETYHTADQLMPTITEAKKSLLPLVLPDKAEAESLIARAREAVKKYTPANYVPRSVRGTRPSGNADSV